MRIVKMLRAIGFLAWPLVLCLPHFVYSKLSESIEPTLFAQGRSSLWWMIVLLYWLIDAAIVIGLVAIYQWPIYPRRVDRMSILVLTSEIATVVLFFHLALLAKDLILHASLDSISLGWLPQFFLIIMSISMLVIFLKYERQNRADAAKDEEISPTTWSSGRRTSALWSPSRKHHRYKKAD